jgi:hypothetical protein
MVLLVPSVIWRSSDLQKGLRLSSSRCGDLRAALPVLAEMADLGSRLVTARVPAHALPAAWAAARARSGKVVVTHPDGLGGS